MANSSQICLTGESTVHTISLWQLSDNLTGSQSTLATVTDNMHDTQYHHSQLVNSSHGQLVTA